MSAMVLLNLWIHVIFKSKPQVCFQVTLNHGPCVIINKSLNQKIISEVTFSQLKHRISEPRPRDNLASYSGIWATDFLPGLFTAMAAGSLRTSA